MGTSVLVCDVFLFKDSFSEEILRLKCENDGII